MTGNSNTESIKKFPDKQGEGRRMELRKKEKDRKETETGRVKEK